MITRPFTSSEMSSGANRRCQSVSIPQYSGNYARTQNHRTGEVERYQSAESEQENETKHIWRLDEQCLGVSRNIEQRCSPPSSLFKLLSSLEKSYQLSAYTDFSMSQLITEGAVIRVRNVCVCGSFTPCMRFEKSSSRRLAS